ncbi:MAG: Tim44 domain-containing protein [Anaerolineales bacterium]
MGGLTGFMLGGLLGGLLFGGLGHGFGFGLLDLLLVAGGAWLLFTLLRNRRSTPQPAYAGAAQSAYGRVESETAAATITGAHEARAGVSDLERGLGHIRQMDPGFDPSVAADETRRLFADLQGALGRRDMGPLRDRLTPEMHATLQAQCDQLRSARQSNRVERIDLRRAEVTEAWQEAGRDFVTVYLEGSLIDYVKDDASGRVVEGSTTTPVELTEYWTLTRPVGRNRWLLSAIQSG